MDQLPDVALGAVIASLVAALVSMAGLIISKEQKTSEFRQAWIDALRADCASVVAQFLNYCEARQFGRAFPDERSTAAMVAYQTSAARVRLSINIKETAGKDVSDRLASMDRMIAEGDADQTRAATAAAALVEAMGPILKAEWARVKRGEYWFRATKVSLLVLILAAFSLLVISLYGRGDTGRPSVEMQALPSGGAPSPKR